MDPEKLKSSSKRMTRTLISTLTLTLSYCAGACAVSLRPPPPTHGQHQPWRRAGVSHQGHTVTSLRTFCDVIWRHWDHSAHGRRARVPPTSRIYSSFMTSCDVIEDDFILSRHLRKWLIASLKSSDVLESDLWLHRWDIIDMSMTYIDILRSFSDVINDFYVTSSMTSLRSFVHCIDVLIYSICCLCLISWAESI